MQKIIKSKINERLSLNGIDYTITYIDIPDFTFIKRIERKITHPEIKGFGNILSQLIWEDDMGELNYSQIPHDENKSSSKGYQKSINDINEDEEIICSEMLNDLSSLIADNKYTTKAIEVFKEIQTKYLDSVNKKVL